MYVCDMSVCACVRMLRVCRFLSAYALCMYVRACMCVWNFDILKVLRTFFLFARSCGDTSRKWNKGISTCVNVKSTLVRVI